MVLVHGGYKKFASGGDILKTIDITKGMEKQVNCIYKDDTGVLVKKGDEGNITQEVNIKESLQAPVYYGDKVGEVSYILNGEKMQTIDIIAEKDVTKSNLWSVTTKLFENWFKINR